ncbi:hypothetical protein SLS53_003581 [Cytospora paraplurivora]|uniref:Uncharacterized protein n=1 Tax=Cytospora paraplurivora TaxID=2898453 RepID=A0AAN9YGM6_9PEZI
MYDLGSQRDDVPFLPLLAGLAIWPLSRIVAARFVRWYSPDFYKYLKSDYEKRYLFFFGLLLGLIAKPPSLIACGLAAWNTAPEDDIAGFRRPMSPSQQFCWGSRTVIYISELPHFLHLPEMVLHHLLSILGMGFIAKYHGPRRGFDLQLAALCSETTNHLRAILKQTHYLKKRPNLDWYLQISTTILLYFIRVPTIFMAMAMIPASGLNGRPARICAIPYLFYLVYILRSTYKRLRNSDILQHEDSGVFRLRIGNHLTITSTSLLTGFAISSTQISVIALYAWLKTEPIPATTAELINLIWHSYFAVVIGLTASRFVAPFLQRVLQWQRLSSVYLLSGLVSAIIFLGLSPALDDNVDKEGLAACVVLSSSLMKAISQYAFHLECIEAGAQSTAKQDGKEIAPRRAASCIPSRASLFCSAFNLLQYVAFVFAVVLGYCSTGEAAVGSFSVQLIIRSAVDSTFDNTGSSMITIASLAMIKTLWGLGRVVISSTQYLDLSGNYTMEDILPTTQPQMLLDWQVALKFAIKDLLTLGGFYLLVSATTTYLSTARYSGKLALPRLRTIGLAAVVVWLCYIAHAVANGENPEISNKSFTAAEIVARQPPFCGLLLSWQFWVSITASVSLSTVAAYLWLPRTVSQAKEVQSSSIWDQE